MIEGKLARLISQSPFVGLIFPVKDNFGFSCYGNKKYKEGIMWREEREGQREFWDFLLKIDLTM